MKEQTAIEKSINEIKQLQVMAEQGECLMPNITDVLNILQNNKAIEKDQIIQAGCCGGNGEKEAEEYYNKTFKSEQ